MFSVIGPDGKTYGPVDTATIRQWIAQGRVTPETVLLDAVTDRQAPARDVMEFADAFAPTAPAYGTTTGAVPPGPTTASGYAQPPNYARPPAAAFAPYPQAAYGAGVSHRSKIVAALLAFFLGSIGVHRFYLGYTTIGVIMLLAVVFTCGFAAIVTGIVALIDFILILTGGLKDFEGRELQN